VEEADPTATTRIGPAAEVAMRYGLPLPSFVTVKMEPVGGGCGEWYVLLGLR
jgi:hypothetical protein